MKPSPQRASQDPQCLTVPRFDEFDPLEPAQLRDAHAILSRARREQPVFYMPKYDMWCVTRYTDALEVFRDHHRFSTTGADMTVAPMPAELRDALPSGHPISNALHEMPPVMHGRVRRLTQKAFSTQKSAAQVALIREISQELIDDFEHQKEVDLVERYAGRIPAPVIAGILGFPREDAPLLKRWTDEYFMLAGNAFLSEQENLGLWRSAIAFEEYLVRQVAKRREKPSDDLTTDLLTATNEEGSASLSDKEVVNVIAGLIGAGSDTTSVLIAEAVDLLLADPERWSSVARDRSLIPKVIEETLRVRSPVRGERRVVTRPSEIGGVSIPEGAVVYVQLGSVNRDESVFEDPHMFRLDRPNIRDHLALGTGAHHCLGATLARTEARVALECLVERLPNMRLVDAQEHLYSATTYVPALLGLTVRLR